MDTNYDYVYVSYCQSPRVSYFLWISMRGLFSDGGGGGGFASSSTCRNWVSTPTVRAYMGVLARVKLHQLRDKATCQGVCPRLCALWWRNHGCIGSITSQRSCGPSHGHKLRGLFWELDSNGWQVAFDPYRHIFHRASALPSAVVTAFWFQFPFPEVSMCPRGAQTSQ